MSTAQETAERTLKMTIEHRYQGSQPRPYADHQYEAFITYYAERKWLMPLPEQVEAQARVLVHDWDNSVSLTSVGYLQKLEMVEEIDNPSLKASFMGMFEQRWHVIVTTPYFD